MGTTSVCLRIGDGPNGQPEFRNQVAILSRMRRVGDLGIVAIVCVGMLSSFHTSFRLWISSPTGASIVEAESW